MRKMLNDYLEAQRGVKVHTFVYSAYTGRCVYNFLQRTNELLEPIAERYINPDYFLVLVKCDRLKECCLCFYGKTYMIDLTSTKYRDRMINLLNDVTSGVYDNARDAFHIEYGHVLALMEEEEVDTDMEIDILQMLYCLWELRYNY